MFYCDTAQVCEYICDIQCTRCKEIEKDESNNDIITNIKYDEIIEVSQKQYQWVIRNYAGAIAHRIENDKYYIKLWVMSYKTDLIKDLNKITG